MLKVQKIYFDKFGKSEEGFLSVAHLEKNIPFPVKRIYWTFKTPIDIIRGRHAHKESIQVIIAVSGKITLELTDIRGIKTQFVLSKPTEGVLIPPNYWHTMEYSEDAIQLIFASNDYTEDDYIREYEKFVEYWTK